MDLSDISNAMSKLSLLKYEENDEDSVIVPTTKRTQFLATYRQQRFLFRASIMLYIAENPTSPTIYQKMIKTCKFFFVQNPILIFCDLYFNGMEWQYNAHGYRKPSSNFFIIDNILAQNPNIIPLDVSSSDQLHNETWHPCPDLAKITSKLWITEKFCVRAKKENDQNIISSIIPKFFRFDAKILRIENQVIPFCDYIYLSSSAEKIFLENGTVQDKTGSEITVEKLVETASKVKVFQCRSETTLLNLTSETFGELLKLPHFHQFDTFYLKKIPECFDIEAFYAYMKKNQRTSFYLTFDTSISEAYKVRLEEIIDEIIATENHDYCIPYISFPGQNFEKIFKLFSMVFK